MWPFPRKQAPISLPIVPADVETLEATKLNGLHQSVEQAIKSAIDAASHYQAFENTDDMGNFFGTEFNIRATAGRIKSTYTREPWIYATSTLIARTLASVPFQVIDNRTDEPIEKHPLVNQLKAGSKSVDHDSMEWAGDLDLCLAGNFFRVWDENFTEVMHVPAECVSINLSREKREVESITIYNTQGGKTVVPYTQVIHHRFPNPYFPYYGLSIYTAASRPILLDRYKNEFEMAFYLRGATNAGVIETTEDIAKSRMERLMRTFEQVYTGKRNWWRTVFLPKGAKWIKAGLTMSEMQHLEGLRENRLTILAVLGIPPSKLGIVQDVNRSTSEAQDKDFWENTVKPLAKFMAAGWNNSHLVKVIHKNAVRVEPNFDEVEALQGSIITKGERAKALEPYFLIDEIRSEVFGKDALPNGLGQQLTAQVKAAAAPTAPTLTLVAQPNEAPALPEAATVVDTEVATEVGTVLGLKGQVTAAQERIESKLSAAFARSYDAYLDALIGTVVEALKEGRHAGQALKNAYAALEEKYVTGVEPTLIAALERGFSFASAQSKLYRPMVPVGKTGLKARLRFSELDQQAIEALRDEQRNGERTALVKRAIDSFKGFNDTRTKEVLDLIAEGLEGGKTLEQIAATIRTDYGETYKNQSFTIARTEVLTAISQGTKWNHEILKEVFNEVQKQWFHVGDAGSNPHARENHVGFEDEGPVPANHKWGGILDYPRDPDAGPEETINCRCSMVSVVPDGANSNAEEILDRLL